MKYTCGYEIGILDFCAMNYYRYKNHNQNNLCIFINNQVYNSKDKFHIFPII